MKTTGFWFCVLVNNSVYPLISKDPHVNNIIYVNPHYFNKRGKEEFGETKGVTRIRISKKNRQHKGQKKKYERTNNDQQNIYIQLKIE